MPVRRHLVAERMGPAYQQVADGIRDRITSGKWPVGELIPSTRLLQQEFTVSETVVRRAVRELQDGGVLIGHPGKGVYVQALPEDADSERGDLRKLGKEVAALQEQVDDLRERFGRMEAKVATVAGKSRGGRREQGRAVADGGQH